MLLQNDTLKYQTDFATFCITGKWLPIPGVNTKHVSHYPRLIRNIFFDNMATAFPITKKTLKETDWDFLVSSFLTDHKAQSHEVWRLPREFWEFVVAADFGSTLNYPFLNDLLLFEWLEIEVYTMADLLPNVVNVDTNNVILNPEHRLIRLEYPVHSYKPGSKDFVKGEYFVVAVRAPETGAVRFIELSVIFAWIVEYLNHNQVTFQQLVETVNDTFQLRNIELTTDKILKFARSHKELFPFFNS